MTLPRQIPRRLRSNSVSFADMTEGQGAWSRVDAVAVLESLAGTTLAVSNVDVFEPAPWGYVPSNAAWSGSRLPGEADPDYASRTRAAALAFIRAQDRADPVALFVLEFPIWKDAA